MSDQKSCTCHSYDDPPIPCERKYALSECRKAENDRLRAENAELRSQNIQQETRVQDAENDLNNLRAENAELKSDPTAFAFGLFNEVKRLRAENAEMMEIIDGLANIISPDVWPAFQERARAILAKTEASHGQA